jgi:hypothetical protein
VTTIMIEKRGFESALSACPAPAAAFAVAAPAQARPRAALSGYGLPSVDRRVAPFQGTGLPVAGQVAVPQCINDVPTMLFQSYPGDTARRPPA